MTEKEILKNRIISDTLTLIEDIKIDLDKEQLLQEIEQIKEKIERLGQEKK